MSIAVFVAGLALAIAIAPHLLQSGATTTVTSISIVTRRALTTITVTKTITERRILTSTTTVIEMLRRSFTTTMRITVLSSRTVTVLSCPAARYRYVVVPSPRPALVVEEPRLLLLNPEKHWSPPPFPSIDYLYQLLGFSNFYLYSLGYDTLVAVGRGLITAIGIYNRTTLKPVKIYVCSVLAKRVGYVEPADLVFVNRSFMICAVRDLRIIHELHRGSYVLVVFSGSEPIMVANLSVAPRYISVAFSSSMYSSKPLLPINTTTLGRIDPLAAAILAGFSSSDVSRVGEILKLKKVGPRYLALWLVLSSVSKDVRYSANISRACVETPLQTLEHGEGRCIDYALLTAAALMYEGFERSFIALIYTSSGLSHAVALEPIDGSLFVLDQRPPPIEWSDYLQYVLSNASIERVDLYEIALRGSEPQVYEWLNVSLRSEDLYPEDSLPKGFSYRVAMEVARALNSSLCPELSTLRGFVGTIVELSGLKVVGITRGSYPLSRLYSPLFDSYWVHLYASRAIEVLRRLGAKPRCLWLSIESGRGSDVLWIYSTPFKPPPVAIESAGKYVSVVVGSALSQRNLAVAIYRGGKLVAQLVPRGFTCLSSSVKCLESVWIRGENYTLILIPRLALERAGIEPSDFIVVWVRGFAVYGARVGAWLRSG
ncbi:MAG: hypothetical protein GXO32_03510 [Crenarchaeota archaeon]|nr:hypothetical protein [Thermoproteota archaeon]